MQSQDLKVFKIFYSGEIKQIETTDFLELFSSVNVIGFYPVAQKRLYIWIGENASRTLKNYIVQFRQTFTDDYPNYRVLRYITIESEAEPFDFFQNTGISKEDLHTQLTTEKVKYTENAETLAKINILKDEADTAFENKDYENAITTADKIIVLAEAINDESIIKDQNEFIAEAEARAKAKNVLKDIREEKKNLNYTFRNMKNEEEIMDLYQESKIFEQKYGDYLDLPALTDVVELINKIENEYKEYQARSQVQFAPEELAPPEEQKPSDLDSILPDINELREKANNALENRKLLSVYENFKKIVRILEENNN